ncbi:DNA-processing protein DprA [Nesterenkonia sp. K-15-9-6]|uniref:DNA-processing protein DprA n=1 Tax=Nesterenkonia sp. K-15-9-6 TaxID=3093918 RepID=UPI00404395C8
MNGAVGQDRGRPAVDEDLLRVRAELSRLVEPGDALAGLLVAHLGPVEAHALIMSEADPGATLTTQIGELGAQSGLGARQRDLHAGLARWRTRRRQAQGARDLETIWRFGGGLTVPEDPWWPSELEDLGGAAPLALWHRGAGSRIEAAWGRLPRLPRRVAVVGSREASDYGLRVTAEIVEDLVGHGVCIVSGGAYGIDAAAHRAALRRDGAAPHGAAGPTADGAILRGAEAAAPTVAVLAGGLDRFYPAGNDSLLRAVGEHGLLVSEMPPGGSPTRHRFLHRNRLIAALTAATVVVESRWRSGAQNTAHHALGLGRPVGAVPGSVHAARSAGCHRLLRETPAEVITDAADVVSLIAEVTPTATSAGPADPRIGGLDQPRLPLPERSGPTVSVRTAGDRGGRGQDAGDSGAPGERARITEVLDGLDQTDRLLFDALPLRRLSTAGKLSEVAGLPMPQVLGGLTRLQRCGLARESGGRWGRSHGVPPTS